MNLAEPAERVRAYAAEMQLSFRVVIDEHGDVAQTYGVRYTPTHFLIDRAGIVRAAGSGNKEWNGLAHAAVRVLLAP